MLIAIGVTEDGYREILGAAEGLKEDLESRKNFFVWLKSRGLEGVKQQIQRIAAFAKMKQSKEALGKPAIPIVLNMEFAGNPGTAE